MLIIMFCEASDSTQMRCTLGHVICRGDLETPAATDSFDIHDYIAREEAASVQGAWPTRSGADARSSRTFAAVPRPGGLERGSFPRRGLDDYII